MNVECIMDYKIPVFEDDVFNVGKNYTILGMTEIPEGGIDVIVMDEYQEKWGFILNKGDETSEMYVYSNKNRIGYIGTGELFDKHFKLS